MATILRDSVQRRGGRLLPPLRWTLFLVVLSATMCGCTPVSPWQKGNLAKRHMSFDPDPLEAKVRAHTQESKEGSAGGYGPGGGGCGCS